MHCVKHFSTTYVKCIKAGIFPFHYCCQWPKLDPWLVNMNKVEQAVNILRTYERWSILGKCPLNFIPYL